MKKFLLIVGFSISCLVFGQEVKLKKGMIEVGGNVWAKYEKCGGFDSECSVIDKDNNEIVFMKTAGSASGKNYDRIEITFINTGEKVEYRKFGHFKKIIQLLVYNKVLNEDKIESEKLKNFILKYDEKTVKLNYNN